MNRWGWAACGVAVGLVVGVGGTIAVSAVATAASSSPADAPKDSRISSAYNRCHGSYGMTLEDDGKTLVLDTKGSKDASGASSDAYSCVLAQLNAPKRVQSHMEQTTALDGRQSESWDGVDLSWSYHPDRGLDAIFTLSS